MDIKKLPPGSRPPHEVFVVIEVGMNQEPIKYEFNKEMGCLVVDRFMHTSMQYPCNYGFIPNTLSGDGDPVDVLVYSTSPIMPGAIISVKPIGVLITEDEKGQDEKILAVPTQKVDPTFKNINSYSDLPEILINKISHFFRTYKDLEPNKWVKVKEWQGPESAQKVIETAILKGNDEIGIRRK